MYRHQTDTISARYSPRFTTDAIAQTNGIGVFLTMEPRRRAFCPHSAHPHASEEIGSPTTVARRLKPPEKGGRPLQKSQNGSVISASRGDPRRQIPTRIPPTAFHIQNWELNLNWQSEEMKPWRAVSRDLLGGNENALKATPAENHFPKIQTVQKATIQNRLRIPLTLCCRPQLISAR
jgi:hypothetical protein